MESNPNVNPRDCTADVRQMLNELIAYLREDVQQVDEPKAQALFETSAEVLQGLQTAFTHYEQGVEPGMQRQDKDDLPEDESHAWAALTTPLA